MRVLLEVHTNGLDVRVLDRACGLLRYSCGNPKLSRRAAECLYFQSGKTATPAELEKVGARPISTDLIEIVYWLFFL